MARNGKRVVEDRHKIARRGIDDLQHLGYSGLPLERLVALGKRLIPLRSALSKLTL